MYVYDFTINSHNKIIGFQIQNPSSPASSNCVTLANAGTDMYVVGNHMYACGGNAMISGSGSTDSSSYVYIQNNTLTYACSTSASPNVCTGIRSIGDHHLVENNDISHVSDGISFFGSYNVVRGNTFHDVTSTDCGTHSSNCHIDFIESEPGIATQYNLYEANTVLNNSGANGHAYLAQGDACSGQCSNLIVRFNSGAHVGSAGILDDNAGNSGVAGFSYVKSYNNTWVDFSNDPSNQAFGVGNSFTNNSTHGSQKNELFYYPESLADYNPYAIDSSTTATFSESNNLAYCAGATCNLRSKVYGGGAFTDGVGNIKADPLFVSYVGDDFRLSVGSPAIGAGTHLTTVAAGDSGSGTLLAVADASYFSDGSGIVNADWIRVGASTTVQISSINYATNTITLANSIARSASDPVYLYKNSGGTVVLLGSVPDIGAYQYVPPPQGVTHGGPISIGGPVRIN